MKLPIPRDLLLLTLALMVCIFLTALDVTVVGIAMPTIIGSLGGLELYSWVFAAYLLTGTIGVPIYGKLADLYGRKPVFMAGAGLFLLGSVLCGIAQSMEQLILFRAIQGLGSGAVFPITMTIIGDVFTLEQRARVQGVFSSVWGVSSVVGPAVGGFITDHASWRWIFYLNLPTGLAAMALLGWTFRERVEHRRHRIDWPGAVLLAMGITALLLAFMQTGGSSGTPALTAGMLACAALSTAAFIWQERRAPEPLLPLELFRSRLIAASSLGAFFVGAALFGSSSFVPPFVQGVLGQSATATGLPLIAHSVAWSLGSVIGGRIIIRTGYRLASVLGGLAIAGGILGLAVLTEQSSLWLVAATMVPIGIGMGFCSLAFLLSVQNAVDWNQRGVITSSNQFFRSIGGTIGVSLVGAVFNARLGPELASLPGGSAVDPDALLEPAARAMLPPELLPDLALALQRALQSAYVTSLLLALAVIGAACLLPGGRAAEHAWNPSSEAGVEPV